MQDPLKTSSGVDAHPTFTQQIFSKDHAHIEEHLISKFSSCRTLATYHDNLMLQYIKHAVTNSLNFRQVLIIFRNKSQNTGYVNLIPIFSSLLSLISANKDNESSDVQEITHQYKIECYKSILTVFRNYQMFLLDELVSIYTMTIQGMFETSAMYFKTTYLKRFSENFLILDRMQSYVPDKDFLKFYDVYRTVRLNTFTEYIKLDMYQHAYRLITPLLHLSNKNEINIFDSFEKEDLDHFFDDLEAVQRKQFNLLGLSCLELERHQRKHDSDLVKGALYILCNRDLSNRFESKLPIERDAEENAYKIITEEKKKFEHKHGKNKDFALVDENMDIKTLIENYIKELKLIVQKESDNLTVQTIIELLEYILYSESFLTANILNLASSEELISALSNLQIDGNINNNIENENEVEDTNRNGEANKERLLFLIVKTTIYKIYDIIMAVDDVEMIKEELYNLLCVEDDIEEEELLSLISIDDHKEQEKDASNKNSNHYGPEISLKFGFFNLLFAQQIDIKKYVILLLISVNKHILKVTEGGIKLQKIVSNVHVDEENENTGFKTPGGVKGKKEELNIEEVKKEILDKGINVFKEELKRGYANLRKFHRNNDSIKRAIKVDTKTSQNLGVKEDKKEDLKNYLNTTNDCEDHFKEYMDSFIIEVTKKVDGVYNKEMGDFNQMASEIRHMKNTTLYMNLFSFNKKKQNALINENRNKTIMSNSFEISKPRSSVKSFSYLGLN